MSIFDLVQSSELAAYWEVITQGEPPYPLEELFPNDKKRGLDLKWIKGAKGLPAVLKTSAFDVQAIARPRIGFEKISAEMPFFKESTYIDEELRQELNMVLETGNQAYIDSVMNRVFDDEMQLIRSASVSRERMRAQLLTTGTIAMTSNGQTFLYDYGLPSGHKSEVSVSWSDSSSDPIEDMRAAAEKILDDTGEVITRAIMNSKTLGYLRNNDKIKKAIYVLSNGVGAITNQKVIDFVSDQLDITIGVDDKKYKDEKGTAQKFIPDDTAVLIPDGTLGTTWFGTTPEESDLMSSGVANVSIVDMGVAVTTIKHVDPVNVETKVSMICLPSFEMADSVYILDVKQGS